MVGFDLTKKINMIKFFRKKEEPQAVPKDVSEEVSEDIDVEKVKEENENENENELSSEEIERYKTEMQTIIGKVEEIVKNEDEPMIFRQQSILEQGYWQLSSLEEDIEKSLKNREITIMPEELKNEIEKCRNDIKSVSDDIKREIMNNIAPFKRMGKEERENSFSMESTRNRYSIEEKAMEYLDCESKIKNEIKTGEFNEEEIEELQGELDVTKESISKQYIDLGKKEREVVKEKHKEKLAKLREEIGNLREPEETSEEEKTEE